MTDDEFELVLHEIALLKEYNDRIARLETLEQFIRTTSPQGVWGPFAEELGDLSQRVREDWQSELQPVNWWT